MKKRQRSYKTTTSTEVDYVRVIKISIGVILVLALVYFGTAFLSGEIDLDKKSTKTEEETTIQYQEIIGGEMLNRKAKEYFVLLYDFKDNYNDYYQSLIKSYTSKDNSLPFYTVDLSKKINEDYKVPEEDKEKLIEYDTFKVEDVTLVKVVDTKLNVVAEGKDKVAEYLQNN